MKDKGAVFGLIILMVVVIAGIVIGVGKGKSSDSVSDSAGDQDSSQIDNNTDPVQSGDNGESIEFKEKLAKFMAQKGAVMYGAFWCSHCKEQKKAFGDAFKYINYVECDAAGENANPDECSAKGIKGYPTWIYQGKSYSGFKSLSELATIVGFADNSAQEDDLIDEVITSENSTGATGSQQ